MTFSPCFFMISGAAPLPPNDGPAWRAPGPMGEMAMGKPGEKPYDKNRDFPYLGIYQLFQKQSDYEFWNISIFFNYPIIYIYILYIYIYINIGYLHW